MMGVRHTHHELDFNCEVWNPLEAASSQFGSRRRHRGDRKWLNGRGDRDNDIGRFARSRYAASRGRLTLLKVGCLELLARRHCRK